MHPKQRLGLWLLGLDPEHAPPDDTPVNELLFGGAGGGGKSEFDRMVAFRIAEQWPGSKGAVVRKAGPDLIKTQVEPFLSRSPEGDQGWNWRLMRYRFLNGSEVEFHSCYEDLDYLRFRSYDWDWIVFDEATELSEETLTFMRSRAMRSTGKLGWTPKIIYTSNPLGPGNEFFVKTFVDGHPSDGTPWIDEVKLPNGHSYKMKRAFIQSKVQDNPSVPEDEALFGMEFIADPELRRAIRDGDWHLTTDTFFSSFRRNQHVVPHFTIPEDWIVWRGLDWGTRDPAACLWLARNPKAEFLRTYVFREWWSSGLADYQQAKAILALSKADPPAKITLCDPSAVDQYKKGLGTNHAQEWAAAGLYVTAANNRRPIGWQRIHRALAHGDNWPVPTELQIMDTCPELINQIEHAKRDKDDAEDIKEPRNPTDLRDEMLDCVERNTLVTTDRGRIPICDVTSSDQVSTRAGYLPVKACWKVGHRVYVTLFLADGTYLRCTKEHRIWASTHDEWPKWFIADDIYEDHIVWTETGWVKVIGYTDAQMETEVEVWDLQVDDPAFPEFYANGILVHNCLRYSLLGARAASSTRPTAQHKTYRLVAGRRR